MYRYIKTLIKYFKSLLETRRKFEIKLNKHISIDSKYINLIEFSDQSSFKINILIISLLSE